MEKKAKVLHVNFPENANAFQRNTMIREEMLKTKYVYILDAFLHQRGQRNSGSFYKEDDLEQADSIEIHYH